MAKNKKQQQQQKRKKKKSTKKKDFFLSAKKWKGTIIPCFLVVMMISCCYFQLVNIIFISTTNSPYDTTATTTQEMTSFIPGSIPKQQQHHHQRAATIKNEEIEKVPPISDYIQGWEIIQDVNWLLDFAIVGFPKTGTSTLMNYFGSDRYNQQQNTNNSNYTSSATFIFQDERCEIGWNQHVKLLKDLYQQYKKHNTLQRRRRRRQDTSTTTATATATATTQQKMGIKCPGDLENQLARTNYRQYFPNTKFIVGVRHPILWFESFYNFRINNEFLLNIKPEKLIGKCHKYNQGVCTYRANFSNHLQHIETTRNVFLYDVGQLKEDNNDDGNNNNNNSNTTRQSRFRYDLQQFLSLSTSLDKPMEWIKPGQKPYSVQRGLELDALKIDICDEEHDRLRRILLDVGSHSATWIKNVFMKQPNVFVSSPSYFIRLIEKWHTDPCEERRKISKHAPLPRNKISILPVEDN